MKIKKGDQVDFKNDVEGNGEVVAINNGFMFTDYTIAVTEPGSNNAEPTHPMANFNYKYKCMTVTVDEDHIWKS